MFYFNVCQIYFSLNQYLRLAESVLGPFDQSVNLEEFSFIVALLTLGHFIMYLIFDFLEVDEDLLSFVVVQQVRAKQLHFLLHRPPVINSHVNYRLQDPNIDDQVLYVFFDLLFTSAAFMIG